MTNRTKVHQNGHHDHDSAKLLDLWCPPPPPHCLRHIRHLPKASTSFKYQSAPTFTRLIVPLALDNHGYHLKLILKLRKLATWQRKTLCPLLRVAHSADWPYLQRHHPEGEFLRLCLSMLPQFVPSAQKQKNSHTLKIPKNPCFPPNCWRHG